jgi:hypothetical protein
MQQLILNIFMSASIISLALWVAKANPILGGFVISLPLSTLIALAFSKLQNHDVGNTFLLAKSIFVAVPLTLVFFVPFLLAERMKLSFWTSYLIGLGLLSISFGVHKWITINWMR